MVLAKEKVCRHFPPLLISQYADIEELVLNAGLKIKSYPSQEPKKTLNIKQNKTYMIATNTYFPLARRVV